MVPPDLAYKLRKLQDSRKDEGRGESPLTMDHLTEFRTVLRHYVNFMQKWKVREKGEREREGRKKSEYTFLFPLSSLKSW